MSKGQNISPKNIHGQQVLHKCDHGMNFRPAACMGYDTETFRTLIPPLHRSRSYNFGVDCSFFLIVCALIHMLQTLN